MNTSPQVKGNPLKISVYSLIICYLVGEFIIPKYNLVYPLNLLGIMGLIISIFFFISGFNLFRAYKENPLPQTSSKKLIKTGIFAYSRNPIYLSFILFHFSMFMTFENVMYFLTSIILAIWLNNYVVKQEEKYLLNEFSDEFKRYMNSVSKWFFL